MVIHSKPWESLLYVPFFFNPYENGVIIPTQGLGIQSNLTRLDYGTCGGFLSYGYLPPKLI